MSPSEAPKCTLALPKSSELDNSKRSQFWQRTRGKYHEKPSRINSAVQRYVRTTYEKISNNSNVTTTGYTVDDVNKVRRERVVVERRVAPERESRAVYVVCYRYRN